MLRLPVGRLLFAGTFIQPYDYHPPFILLIIIIFFFL